MRSQWQYPARAEVPNPAPETTSLDKWAGYQPPQIFRWAPLTVAVLSTTLFSFHPNPIVAAETVTADKWIGSQPARLDRKRVSFPSGQQLLDPRPAAEDVTCDKWAGSQPSRLNPQRRAVESITIADPKPEEAVAETITLDKWIGAYPTWLAHMTLRIDSPGVNLVEIVTTYGATLSITTPGGAGSLNASDAGGGLLNDSVASGGILDENTGSGGIA